MSAATRGGRETKPQVVLMSARKELIGEHAFRTILLWLLWAAAAIVVYFMLYLDTDVWVYIQQDQSKITWVIILLFLVGLGMSFTLAVSITHEALQAVELGNIARQKSLPGVNPDGSVHAVQRFFLALKQIIEHNSIPDIEALIDVELAGYQRRSHAVEVMGNLLITLGLIGTVIGLTLTLAGLTTSLDALGVDHDRLMRGLESAMGGMGTAFYTTLLGSVLGGVLLRVFALITGHGINSLSDSLKKICMVYCAADTKPTVQRDVRALNEEIQVLGDNVKALQAAFSDTRSAMSDFQTAAKELNQVTNGEDKEQTLRDSVVLQMYYTDLLKQEIRMMNRVNRSWWTRLRKAMRRLGAGR